MPSRRPTPRAQACASAEQFGSIVESSTGPLWSKTHVPTTARGTRLSTVNARTEGMEKSPTYKDAWARGKRCIIPAASFDEPNWETGKNLWWRFRRADRAPWGPGRPVEHLDRQRDGRDLGQLHDADAERRRSPADGADAQARSEAAARSAGPSAA